MAEWLILSLLVPAIVAPAVLLFGFSGCSIDRIGTAPTPVIDSAVGISASVIRLTWHYSRSVLVQFERIKILPDETEESPETFDTMDNPHDDAGREAATTYRYRLQGFDAEGVLIGHFSVPVPGRTLPGPAVSVFTILTATQDAAFGHVGAKTVKCEIPLAELMVPPFPPGHMFITLGQQASDETITFSRVFIGHKAPAGDPPAGDPWDAVALTQVFFRTGTEIRESVELTSTRRTVRSEQIDFAWDTRSALILSMFFLGGGGATSDELSARRILMPDGSESLTHLKDAVDEAATADAAGYTSYANYLSGVILIEVTR